MAVGLKNSSGTDFDSLFHQGTGNQLFYIYTNAGTDVGQRYLPASSGTAGANCNFKNSSSQDIGPKLCKINTVIPAYTSQTLSGSGTFTVPANVTKLRVTIKGGGGGGGGGLYILRYSSSATGSSTLSKSGGSGGKGGYRQDTISTSAGSTFSYSVGGGGGGGAKNYLTTLSGAGTYYSTGGGNGGTSTFGSYSSTGGGSGTRASATFTKTEYTYGKWDDTGYYYTLTSSSNGSAGSAGSPSGSGGNGGAGGSGNNNGSNGSGGSIVVEYGVGIQ